MPEIQINTSHRTRALLAAVFVYIERYAWLLAIMLFMLTLFIGYHFVLFPQYQYLIGIEQEANAKKLQQKKDSITDYLTHLSSFIAESENVTHEELIELAAFLEPPPEPLVLHIALQKLFDQYDAEVSALKVGEPLSVSKEADGAGESSTEPDDVNNLKSLLGDSLTGTPDSLAQKNPGAHQLTTTDVPVSVSFLAPDYFTMKDIMRDIEQRSPLMDVGQITLTVSEEGTSFSLEMILHFFEG